MKRILILTLLSFGLTSLAFSQTAEEQKQKINRIKKDKAYLYVEITTNDAETSRTMVEDMLNEEINKYVATQKSLKGGNVIALNMTFSCETIALPRGNMFRAFRYVKKSDILTADNVQVTEKAEPRLVSEVQQTISRPAYSVRQQETINRLLALKRLNEVEPLVKSLLAEKRIQVATTWAKMETPEQYVLIVYNRDGGVDAILSEGTNRVNLRSGQADSVKNYPERGALGVILNN